jgi:hypothetical protein
LIDDKNSFQRLCVNGLNQREFELAFLLGPNAIRDVGAEANVSQVLAAGRDHRFGEDSQKPPLAIGSLESSFYPEGSAVADSSVKRRQELGRFAGVNQLRPYEGLQFAVCHPEELTARFVGEIKNALCVGRPYHRWATVRDHPVTLFTLAQGLIRPFAVPLRKLHRALRSVAACRVRDHSVH